MSNLSWTQPHTPCNRCVRFATTVASGHATLATKQDATLYLGRTCTGWIAPALRLAHLFDHLVSADEQCRWKCKTERLRSFEIDLQRDPCRLLNRNLCRLGTSENFTNEHSGSPEHVERARSVAHQAARSGEVGRRKNGWNRLASYQCRELIMVDRE